MAAVGFVQHQVIADCIRSVLIVLLWYLSTLTLMLLIVDKTMVKTVGKTKALLR